jgi:hypothetical protein
MEMERLARHGSRKRQASISPPPIHRTDWRQDKKVKLSAAESLTTNVKPFVAGSTRAVPITVSAPQTLGYLEFPKGTIKRTWAKGFPRANDITIEEVLQKDKLKTAVLSSFMWDPEWIFGKIDTKKTNMILVMQAKTDEEREQHQRDALEQGFTNIRLCFPPLNGTYTCMHSKLMLLFYTDTLRIVVPTANLTAYDWGESGVMENSVFLIDLPRRKDGHQSTSEDLTFFGIELMYFLERMGLQEGARNGVLNFDFSNTTNIAFIHSIFGPHYDDDLNRTGSPGLSRAIKKLGLECRDTLELDFASSSIGSLTDYTINNFYEAAHGRDVVSTRGKLKAANTKTKINFRIYFPTHETVAQSRGGLDSAGTICLQEKYYNKIDFPRSIFRDYRSTRQGLLSHNKLVFARGFRVAPEDNEGTQPLAWVYVGSANMSESAWGRLVQDRSRKIPKLTCNNWECGVVVSVPVEMDDPVGETLEKVFCGVVDIPFEHPGQHYRDRAPWYFMEQ